MIKERGRDIQRGKNNTCSAMWYSAGEHQGRRCLGWLESTMVGDPSVFGTELGARHLGKAR